MKAKSKSRLFLIVGITQLVICFVLVLRGMLLQFYGVYEAQELAIVMFALFGIVLSVGWAILSGHYEMESNHP
jgi:hypothetical protein